MDSKEYQKQALRTNGPDRKGVAARFMGMNSKEFVTFYGDDNLSKIQDLLHAGMGLVTESGEFLDTLKKHIYYGKELDKVNLIEELGDQLWYCAIALNALGSDFETAMQINIDKLKSRYPEKFTEELAKNRDLEKERSILEKNEK